MPGYRAKMTTESRQLMGERDQVYGTVQGQRAIITASYANSVQDGELGEFYAETVQRELNSQAFEGTPSVTSIEQSIIDQLDWQIHSLSSD